jgi:hypothetical protein
VSAWIIESDCVLFGSVDTSVFHGLSASNRRPDGAVVGVAAVVDVLVLLELVVGACVLDDVEVDDVVGRFVDEDVEVGDEDELLVDEDEVVAVVVDVEDEVDDDVVLGGRVVDVLVVEVDVVVVVVFFLRAVSSKPQTQPVHASPAGQSAAVSHVSPAAASSRPSPQLDADAVNARRAVRRAISVPSIVAHESATFAFRRTFRSAPQAVQRARMTVAPSRFATRARAGGQ